MNKPLILGGIGALRPQKWRLEVLRLVREEIERALQRGNPIGGEYSPWLRELLPAQNFGAILPRASPDSSRASNCSSQSVDVCFLLLAGFILSGLSHPDMTDASGWSVYYTSKGVHSARLPVANLNTQVGAGLTAGDLGCCNQMLQLSFESRTAHRHAGQTATCGLPGVYADCGNRVHQTGSRVTIGHLDACMSVNAAMHSC